MSPCFLLQSEGGSDWIYTMARSMRLGASALSPRSLASGALDESCASGPSEAGDSYLSTSVLGSSMTPIDRGLMAPSPGGDTPILGGSSSRLQQDRSSRRRTGDDG
eukprot:jgi/Chrzof1/13240/Cz07g25250.t1